MSLIKSTQAGLTASVELAGIPELLKQLTRVGGIPGSTRAQKILLAGGRVLRDEARRRAPFDPTRTTGTHLRDAIIHTRGRWDPANPSIVVMVRRRRRGAPHAHLLEYGTRRMQARPFMRPAVAVVGGRIVEQIARDLARAIEAIERGES